MPSWVSIHQLSSIHACGRCSFFLSSCTASFMRPWPPYSTSRPRELTVAVALAAAWAAAWASPPPQTCATAEATAEAEALAASLWERLSATATELQSVG